MESIVGAGTHSDENSGGNPHKQVFIPSVSVTTAVGCADIFSKICGKATRADVTLADLEDKYRANEEIEFKELPKKTLEFENGNSIELGIAEQIVLKYKNCKLYREKSARDSDGQRYATELADTDGLYWRWFLADKQFETVSEPRAVDTAVAQATLPPIL